MKLIPPLTIPDSGVFSRATTATYFDSAGVMQTAAVDAPRLNYDPADLTSPPVWLLEAASTNLVTRSEDLSHADWTKSDATITANVIAAPTGAVTMDKIVEAATTAQHEVSCPIATIVAGQSCAAAIFLKAAERTCAIVRLSSSSGTFSSVSVAVDLSTGEARDPAYLSGGAVSGDAEIVDVGGGIYRVEFVGVLASDVSQASILVYLQRSADPSTTFSYAGNGASGLYAWGAQIEVAAAVSSYIPTLASPVMRSADVRTLGLLSNLIELDASLGEVAWNNTTKYVAGDQVANATTHKIYQSLVGSSFRASITNASPGVITALNAASLPTAHDLTANMPVEFTTTGGLPTGLSVGVTYYVLNPTLTTFQLTATAGGTVAINTSSAGSGVHTAWANVNKNIDPTTDTDEAYWGDAGPTNKWAPFDSSPSSVAQATGVLAMAITPGKRFDSLSLLSIDAPAMRVVQVDPIDGIVYDETFSLIDNSGITSPYAWFFQPPRRRTDISITGLKNYSASTIYVTLYDSAGGVVQCGVCALGLAIELGDTQYGARIGITDYSVKSTNDFGRTVIVERAYSRFGEFELWVKTVNVDGVINILAKYRAQAVIYVGSTQFGSTMFYGFYNDFNMAVQFSAYGVMSVQLKGLT